MNTKLNEKTKLAMGDTLVMWLKISRGLIRDKGSAQNPLCELFIKNVDCEGCPIKNKTRQSQCMGTPYPNWLKHHEFVHPAKTRRFGYQVECAECKEIARDMFDFFLDMLFDGD